MQTGPATLESLRRVFKEGFTARDIAEPLASLDDTAPSVEVRRWMNERRYIVIGVRRQGIVAGCVQLEDLGDGICGDAMRVFDEFPVLPDSAPLAEVVLRLVDSPRVFVRFLGSVAGIITRTDLQKPPVRMWLFGIVTLIEMRWTAMIESALPNESWRQYLSEGRISKAEQLLAERMRRQQQLELIDCLQLADKGQILARHEPLRQETRFASRRQLEQAVKALEALRNNLAHAQDIIACDWEAIVLLSENLDRVIQGPPNRS